MKTKDPRKTLGVRGVTGCIHQEVLKRPSWLCFCLDQVCLKSRQGIVTVFSVGPSVLQRQLTVIPYGCAAGRKSPVLGLWRVDSDSISVAGCDVAHATCIPRLDTAL